MRDLKADLELCNKATPGPWYARATDDEVFMNLRYVTTEPASFEHDGCRSFTEGIVQSGDVVALTLLQHPRMADPDKFDENTLFIAQAREGWPHAIERAIKAETLARELVAALREISEILDNATCRCRCGFCEYFKAQKIAEKSLAKAKEVLGDE